MHQRAYRGDEMTQQFLNIPIVLGGTLAPGTTYIYAMPVPSDNEGGGITVTGVNTFSNYAMAAASAPILTVVALGTASAGSVVATIASCGSHAWTAGTAVAGTLSTVWVDQDAGHYHMAIKWEQTAAQAGSADAGSADAVRANLTIGYQQGR